MKLPRSLSNSLQCREAFRLIHSPFVRYKPRNRLTVTCDDNFLASFDTVKETPESVFRLKCPNLLHKCRPA
jgi:hypothetical protein